jgi:hypothetical protein
MGWEIIFARGGDEPSGEWAEAKEFLEEQAETDHPWIQAQFRSVSFPAFGLFGQANFRRS